MAPAVTAGQGNEQICGHGAWPGFGQWGGYGEFVPVPSREHPFGIIPESRSLWTGFLIRWQRGQFHLQGNAASHGQQVSIRERSN